MARPRMYLNPGEIVYFSSGDYSSYSVAGVFLVAKRFHWQEEQDEHIRDCQRKGKYPSGCGFSNWLVQRGHVVEIDADEWHYDY